jgi:maltose O-acetyltransferase
VNKWFRLLRYDWPLHFVLLFTELLPDSGPFLALRGKFASFFLGSCKPGLRLGRRVVFYNPSAIHIGENVYIAYGSVLLAIGEIHVGDDVMLSPYVVLSAGNHLRSHGTYRFSGVECQPIFIGTDCWIGAHTTVLAGVKIGERSLVASNAAVTRGEYPSDSFLAGVPAEVKKVFAPRFDEVLG